MSSLGKITRTWFNDEFGRSFGVCNSRGLRVIWPTWATAARTALRARRDAARGSGGVAPLELLESALEGGMRLDQQDFFREVRSRARAFRRLLTPHLLSSLAFSFPRRASRGRYSTTTSCRGATEG